MYSIAFPNMFSSAKTNLIKDHEATVSNLKLMLLSNQNEMFGDPLFGTILRQLIYEQNNTVLRDIVIDEIYTSIIAFIPQIKLERKDITIDIDKYKITATIKSINSIDNQPDMFSILLMSGDES